VTEVSSFLRDPKELVSVSPHLKTETDPVSETFGCPVIYNSGQWIRSRNPVILRTGVACFNSDEQSRSCKKEKGKGYQNCNNKI
jgi:hypothetical protein